MSEKTLRQETSTVRYHPGSLLEVSTNRETVLSPESFSQLKVILSSHIYSLSDGSGVGKGLFVYINRWNNLDALLPPSTLLPVTRSTTDDLHEFARANVYRLWLCRRQSAQTESIAKRGPLTFYLNKLVLLHVQYPIHIDCKLFPHTFTRTYSAVALNFNHPK